MSKFFIAGIAIFLLLGAGYGVSQAARYIPWDCSDWQAFAHEDRATAILETLAENRGKTLYCGIDQSDTFAKAETWEAGRDHNERDSTEYQGERGRFRGFIAAQEGWLTEGESGITGQSIAVIFEFPKKEKKKRRWETVTRRLVVAHGDAPTLRSPEGEDHAPALTKADALQRARDRFDNSTAYRNAPEGYRTENGVPSGQHKDDGAKVTFQNSANEAAVAYCTAAGYQRVSADGVTISGPMWEYRHSINEFNAHNAWARKTRTWTAVCEKEVRRRK